MKLPIVQEVYWTDEAKDNLVGIVTWIESKWSTKESAQFIKGLEKKITLLQQFPTSCRLSKKRKNVSVGVIDKHNKLVYHYNIKKQIVTILSIWVMKQDPQRFKY